MRLSVLESSRPLGSKRGYRAPHQGPRLERNRELPNRRTGLWACLKNPLDPNIPGHDHHFFRSTPRTEQSSRTAGPSTPLRSLRKTISGGGSWYPRSQNRDLGGALDDAGDESPAFLLRWGERANTTATAGPSNLKSQIVTSSAYIATESVERRILSIRGQKVMIDSDLAELYGVETKALNQAVKRNI